jgi:hypothetical protein
MIAALAIGAAMAVQQAASARTPVAAGDADPGRGSPIHRRRWQLAEHAGHRTPDRSSGCWAVEIPTRRSSTQRRLGPRRPTRRGCCATKTRKASTDLHFAAKLRRVLALYDLVDTGACST